MPSSRGSNPILTSTGWEDVFRHLSARMLRTPSPSPSGIFCRIKCGLQSPHSDHFCLIPIADFHHHTFSSEGGIVLRKFIKYYTFLGWFLRKGKKPQFCLMCLTFKNRYARKRAAFPFKKERFVLLKIALLCFCEHEIDGRIINICWSLNPYR